MNSAARTRRPNAGTAVKYWYIPIGISSLPLASQPQRTTKHNNKTGIVLLLRIILNEFFWLGIAKVMKR